MNDILEYGKENFLVEFDLLSTRGNIGFYKSCIVTQISIYHKSSNNPINLLTRVLFQEIELSHKSIKLLGRKNLNKDYTIAAVNFETTIGEARATLKKLIDSEVFDAAGFTNLKINLDRYLPKKFYPGDLRYRMEEGLALDVNGAYVLEGVDQKRTSLNNIKALISETKLNSGFEFIKNLSGINLKLITDKFGGLLYQFPITILDLLYDILPGWCGFNLKFVWDNRLERIPECTIHAQSNIYEVFSGSVNCAYNKSEKQEVILGNLDLSSQIQIYRKNPDILLCYKSLNCARATRIQAGVTDDNSFRIFITSDGEKKIQIFKDGSILQNGIDYVEYINSFVNSTQIERLSAELKLKQYVEGQRQLALTDIRKLINRNNSGHVYLWDPFLRANEILDTLYYCSFTGTVLRAIGSAMSSKKLQQEKEFDCEKIIGQQRKILQNVGNNNLGLDLEFRMQRPNFGTSFHDRFLMFPGKANVAPRAFSLGTSVNSLGGSQHILQEVQFAQIIIDSFNELWELLDDSKCIVFKYPISV